MKFLYRFLLWQAALDVAIGEATRRAPHYIAADRAAVRKWQDALTQLELPPLFD